MNELQRSLFAMIKETICNSIEYYPVRYNAIKVITPFLDWMGEFVSVYITDDGRITDGEQTLNQLKAMRVFEEFEDWPPKNDYFENYNINWIGHSLDLNYQDSPEGILRYIQGVSRLPVLFEIKPMTDKEDRFPQSISILWKSFTQIIMKGKKPESE